LDSGILAIFLVSFYKSRNELIILLIIEAEVSFP